MLWLELFSIATEHCNFVCPRRSSTSFRLTQQHTPKLVQAPDKGLVLETIGLPHLILPLRFISGGGKTLWLKEGQVVYTRNTVTLHGPVTFYYITIKV